MIRVDCCNEATLGMLSDPINLMLVKAKNIVEFEFQPHNVAILDQSFIDILQYSAVNDSCASAVNNDIKCT